MEAQTFTRKPGPAGPGQPEQVHAEAALTPLERKVLELAGSGVSNGEIARMLWVTELNVVALLASIRTKQALVDDVDAVRCVRSGTHG